MDVGPDAGDDAVGKEHAEVAAVQGVAREVREVPGPDGVGPRRGRHQKDSRVGREEVLTPPALVVVEEGYPLRRRT